jgi:hypothetical protein
MAFPPQALSSCLLQFDRLIQQQQFLCGHRVAPGRSSGATLVFLKMLSQYTVSKVAHIVVSWLLAFPLLGQTIRVLLQAGATRDFREGAEEEGQAPGEVALLATSRYFSEIDLN